MRTAIGLLVLGFVGGVGPVGPSVLLYLTPMVIGTVAAFLILLALSVVISSFRRWSPRLPKAATTRPATRSGAVPVPAPRTT